MLPPPMQCTLNTHAVRTIRDSGILVVYIISHFCMVELQFVFMDAVVYCTHKCLLSLRHTALKNFRFLPHTAFQFVHNVIEWNVSSTVFDQMWAATAVIGQCVCLYILYTLPSTDFYSRE